MEPNISTSNTEQIRSETLRTADLALVRMLRAPPKMMAGQFILETAYQTTAADRPLHKTSTGESLPGQYPRITLHFSLNDCVQDASFESEWKSADFVLISGFEQAVKENPDSKLMNLLASDTFFEVPPGSNFKMPKDTILVMPALRKPTGLPMPGNIRTYKAHDFSQPEVEAMILESNASSGNPSERLSNGSESLIGNFLYADSEATTLLYEYAAANYEATAHPPYNGFITDGQFDANFLRFAADKGLDLQARFDHYLQLLCRDRSKRKMVQNTLRERGYKVQPAGADGWADSSADAALNKIARDLEVTSHRHYGGAHDRIEDIILDYQSKAKSLQETITELNDMKDGLTPGLIQMLKTYGIDLDAN